MVIVAIPFSMAKSNVLNSMCISIFMFNVYDWALLEALPIAQVA